MPEACGLQTPAAPARALFSGSGNHATGSLDDQVLDEVLADAADAYRTPSALNAPSARQVHCLTARPLLLLEHARAKLAKQGSPPCVRHFCYLAAST